MAIKNMYKRGDKPLKVPYVDAGGGGAVQSQAQEADINRILAKYVKTGTLEHQSKYEARYDDMNGMDYHTALNMVANTKTMFNELPAAVRAKFENDPAKLLDFVQDPQNKPEAVRMGLMSEDDNYAPVPSRIDTSAMEPETLSDDHGGTIKTAEEQT